MLMLHWSYGVRLSGLERYFVRGLDFLILASQRSAQDDAYYEHLCDAASALRPRICTRLLETGNFIPYACRP